MENFQKIVLIGGFVIAIVIYILGYPYMAGIVLIIILALVAAFVMAGVGKKLGEIPEVYSILREDAKAVIIKNHGSVRVVNIHVTLVPLDIEFNVPSLDPDSEYEYLLPSMILEAKAIVTFESEKGEPFSHTSLLSAVGESGEEDLLKPMFPMFGWK